jgi:S1/P1 Nuclease
MRRLPSLILFLLFAGLPAWSWWETGHKVVARIAATHLTPAARTRIARILSVPDTPDAVSDALADASIWADQVKGSNGTFSWHFIDLTPQDRRGDEERRCPDQNCLPDRIRQFEEQLKERPGSPVTDPRWTDADALKFLVHFVGDLHQPLHTATDDDLGANCEKLQPLYETAKNVHALWDGGIIASLHQSDSALAADLDEEIAKMHERQRRRLAAGDEMDWIWESHDLALHDIYGKLRIPIETPKDLHSCAEAPAAIQDFKLEVDPAYVESMKPVIRLQLMRAGLRLAKVLNETL